MTVRTYLPLNCETQSGDVYKLGLEGNFAVLSRIALAFAPHEQSSPNMTVRLEAGVVSGSAAPVEVAAQSTGTITAPTTNPRIDRVVIDAMTGVVSVITGTAAASPVAPDIPSGKLPVCQVLLATSTTVITNSLITDERVMAGTRSEAIKVNGIYQNMGTNPVSELDYGTWIQLPSPGVISIYPPAQNNTYVKATTKYDTTTWPYFATDPSKSLIGAFGSASWISGNGGQVNQRLHIDLGSLKVITKIYYENFHNSGIETNYGAKNFTFWGSNEETAFAEMTYAIDTNWTQLTCDISQLVQHIAADQVDPHYINISSPMPYRYYAFKFVDNWGNSNYMGIRRIELQFGAFPWLRTA